jgi:hypothetical protein
MSVTPLDDALVELALAAATHGDDSLQVMCLVLVRVRRMPPLLARSWANLANELALTVEQAYRAGRHEPHDDHC